jgi:HEAT repeats/PBS lyase HEAT-like repeat
MTTPAGTLAEFANLLLLLRDEPERKDEQKLAFKQFVSGLPEADHVLKLTPAGFTWDQVEVPVGRGELAALHDQLRGHRVGELRFPVGLMTSTLLSLVRILAAPQGTYGSFDHLVARLDAAGCGVVPILPFPESPGPSEPEPRRPPRPAVDDDGRLSALGPDALTEAKVGMMHFATLQTHTVNPTMEVMNRLAHAESSAATSEALTQLLAAGEFATRQAEWRELLQAAYGLVELERKSGKSGENRGYGIALRRLLPRSSLERIGRLAAHGNMKAEATAVLRRMGADGTEVLLNLMVNSEDMTERRHYFSALKEMTEGGKLLVHMLSHDQWYVVRNVADLCGELREEKAVHSLAKQMGHSDERVRRAVAGALGKIGGAGAVEPLRRAINDPSPAVRLQAVQELDGRVNRNLAMSLAVAAEQESKGDVLREMYLALGRIGSPEALQALQKAAEPGGKIFKRKPQATRLAAVEGLHAAGPSAAGALKELLADEDRGIRDQAAKALQTLWE